MWLQKGEPNFGRRRRRNRPIREVLPKEVTFEMDLEG